MPTENYLRYHRPRPPADPNQEYMTAQETAYVLGCSVATVRKRLKALGIESKVGRAVVTSKRDRQRLFEAGRKTAKEQEKERQKAAKVRHLRAADNDLPLAA